MHRFGILFTAFGILSAAAVPAWAHHYHSHHYYHSYGGCSYYGTCYGTSYCSACVYYINQGDAWDNQGNHDAAIADYTQAIANDPNCALAYNQRGATYYEMGQFDRAIADYTQAIAVNRNYAAAYNNRGAALDAENEFDKAMADTNIALALEPSFVEAYVSRGAILYNQGKYDDAIAADNQALAIDPSTAQAYGDRASSWNMKGEYEKAKADYYQAIAIDPNNPEYLNELAFFQATCLDAKFRDGKQAFANASKAYQLSNGNNADNNFSVLASCYAENGDFTAALQWQAKALEQVKSQEMKQRYLARVELFKQNKPFRLDPKSAMSVPVVGAAAGATI
jgi:tetratricopeptide (TPR) repeat protein